MRTRDDHELAKSLFANGLLAIARAPIGQSRESSERDVCVSIKSARASLLCDNLVQLCLNQSESVQFPFANSHRTFIVLVEGGQLEI